MNNKFFVPFETAKLLKEKGYPQEFGTKYYYYDNIFFVRLITDRDSASCIVMGDTDSPCFASLNKSYFAAPTYHEVVDWLESKEIYISVYVDFNFHKRAMVYNGYITSDEGEWIPEEFLTLEEALNAEILKALELI